ncbi:MAG: hypothetical protein GYA23_09800 [Methanomicrobiales archaeon]|nr:hypothetical protein [Methanomicrobiales archaeon]
MRHPNEPTYIFVILTFILIVINTILAFISSVFIPANVAGIAYLYPAAAVMILFTLWFGGYGAIAAYIGTLIGAGFLAREAFVQHPQVAILWAVATLVQVLIPLIAVRAFEVDITMEHTRDWSHIILFGVIINNIIGAAWGAFTLALLTPDTMMSVFSTWLIGNVIVCLLIVPLGLKLFTPKIQKSRLFITKYWD